MKPTSVESGVLAKDSECECATLRPRRDQFVTAPVLLDKWEELVINVIAI